MSGTGFRRKQGNKKEKEERRRRQEGTNKEENRGTKEEKEEQHGSSNSTESSSNTPRTRELWRAGPGPGPGPGPGRARMRRRKNEHRIKNLFEAAPDEEKQIKVIVALHAFLNEFVFGLGPKSGHKKINKRKITTNTESKTRSRGTQRNTCSLARLLQKLFRQPWHSWMNLFSAEGSGKHNS